MDDLLNQWDQSLGQAELDRLKINHERRRFLHESGKATAVSSLALGMLPSMALFSACEQTPQRLQADIIGDEPWTTFAAVQQILFPDDGNGPGAADLNATAYLKFVVDAADTDKNDQAFILKGIDWLNQLSRTNANKMFIENDIQQQNELITKIANSQSGERWLSLLLLYIFEALLTDPIYGANPAGIGWKWLEHTPGFPHPPANKIYTELLKR